MVGIERSFYEAIVYLKNLTNQSLSEETKVGIIQRIDNLSKGFRRLREENEKLKKIIIKQANDRNPFNFGSITPTERWVQLEKETAVGMVDLFDCKSPFKKRTTADASRLSTPFQRNASSLRKPEPLRVRNSVQRDPPKEVKFNKYSPLPALKTRPRPKLLRERTYDVIEPVYVKGPLSEDKVKLPELRKSSKTPTTPTTAPRRATTSRVGQLTTPKRNKTLLPEQTPNKRTKQTFNPSQVQPSGDIPNNVFWFPM